MITRNRAYKIREYIEKASVSLDDTDALDSMELFPWWGVDKQYTVGFRVRYGDKLYKVVQAHISQADWTPDVVPALFTEVAPPGEIPVWVQPTGAQDAYMKGDKVKHTEKIWESLIDNNVWEPGAVGTESLWTEVVS